MTFNSLTFLFFTLLLWPLYWLAKSTSFRQGVLLVASLLFYGYWDWRFLPLVVGIAGVAHLCGLAIAKRQEGGEGISASTALGVSVVFSLGLLAFFKYTNFGLAVFADVWHWLGAGDGNARQFNIILPLGISFFTFEALSYCVDVYRGHLKGERSFFKTLLYIAFFPRLSAGPIVRSTDFFPQLHEEKQWSTPQFVGGLIKFLQGFVYKVVFADHLAAFVDPVFTKVSAYDNLTLIGAALGFCSQIYFDFAGYSLMAIGVAMTFGFWLPENFDYPYTSVSVTEFWRRWHISLSSWLRDYLYIPLGGNRGARWMLYRNLMITMVLGGLWHGASWGFVLWGFLHGVALSLHKVWMDTMRSVRSKEWTWGWIVWIPIAWALTQFYILLSWVPFRAESSADAWTILQAITGAREETSKMADAGVPWLLIILPLAVDHIMGRLKEVRSFSFIKREEIVYAVMVLTFLAAIASMALSTKAFIYFQF